ncbi:MAG: hypothetical protein ABH952_03995 [Candidatus Omnitrophota bacterium]
MESLKTCGFQMDKKFPVLHCLISLAKYPVVLLHRRSANALWRRDGQAEGNFLLSNSLHEDIPPLAEGGDSGLWLKRILS